MLFNSIAFLIFFPIVFFTYFAAPYRLRWPLLLVASWYFYMSWRTEYIFLLLASTVLDYVCGMRIEANTGRRRLAWFLLSIGGNLGQLFWFKYYGFASRALQQAFHFGGIDMRVPVYDIVLPVGISFYTFQSLSYTIEVYRGNLAAQRHFGIFALYIAFFPQLVAGPIERATHLLPQFLTSKDFDYDRVVSGLRQMLWGFVKKVFIADRLAPFVDSVYDAPHGQHPVMLCIATLFFAFQIYCDFSGYSDIAIGAARTLGFNLMENFHQPYLARSIGDFWRRWHISLSSWFRDYVYIPLGGNRTSRFIWYRNLMIVFLLSGVWHGANWTFVVWGALHGVYLVAGLITADLRQSIAQALRLDAVPWLQVIWQTIATFVLVCFAWIFFRAESIADAYYIAGNIPNLLDSETASVLAEQWKNFDFRVSCISIALLFVADELLEHMNVPGRFSRLPLVLRWGTYYATMCLLLFWGKFEENAFIYFQF